VECSTESVFHSSVHEGSYDVEVDVGQTNETGPDPSRLEEVIVLTDSNGFGTFVLKGESLGVEYHGKPVEGEDGEEEDSLEFVIVLSSWMVEGVIVKE